VEGIPGWRAGGYGVPMIERGPIRQRWEAAGAKLDERARRLFAAVEMRAAGRGGLAAVFAATGLARSMIGRSKKDPAESPWSN